MTRNFERQVQKRRLLSTQKHQKTKKPKQVNIQAQMQNKAAERGKYDTYILLNDNFRLSDGIGRLGAFQSFNQGQKIVIWIREGQSEGSSAEGTVWIAFIDFNEAVLTFKRRNSAH